MQICSRSGNGKLVGSRNAHWIAVVESKSDQFRWFISTSFRISEFWMLTNCQPRFLAIFFSKSLQVRFIVPSSQLTQPWDITIFKSRSTLNDNFHPFSSMFIHLLRIFTFKYFQCFHLPRGSRSTTVPDLRDDGRGSQDIPGQSQTLGTNCDCGWDFPGQSLSFFI